MVFECLSYWSQETDRQLDIARYATIWSWITLLRDSADNYEGDSTCTFQLEIHVEKYYSIEKFNLSHFDSTIAMTLIRVDNTVQLNPPTSRHFSFATELSLSKRFYRLSLRNIHKLPEKTNGKRSIVRGEQTGNQDFLTLSPVSSPTFEPVASATREINHAGNSE